MAAKLNERHLDKSELLRKDLILYLCTSTLIPHIYQYIYSCILRNVRALLTYSSQIDKDTILL